MKLDEIKTIVNSGKDVYCYSLAYKVIKDSLGRYFIKCTLNGFLQPLEDENNKLIEDEADFHVK
jgi:hypothetical protein